MSPWCDWEGMEQAADAGLGEWFVEIGCAIATWQQLDAERAGRVVKGKRKGDWQARFIGEHGRIQQITRAAMKELEERKARPGTWRPVEAHGCTAVDRWGRVFENVTARRSGSSHVSLIAERESGPGFIVGDVSNHLRTMQVLTGPRGEDLLSAWLADELWEVRIDADALAA